MRMRVFPVLEHSALHRLHYHAYIEVGGGRDWQAEEAIRDCWGRTHYGDKQIHIHSSVDAGWGGYITKFKTAWDEVDWENVYWK